MQRFANPKRFLDLSGLILPWLAGATLFLLALGLYLGFSAPPDYQQSHTVKIMFVHVPAAWTGMMIYALMAISAAVGLIWRHPLADAAAKTAAPLGAVFTALALITGSLWGAPMWGTWWEWDGRMTSSLLMLFLYLGYIALWNAIDDDSRAARATAILALIGAANLPVIHFSVNWWSSLHQGQSILRADGPSMPPVFLGPLFTMALAYTLLFYTLWLLRLRTEILERRARTLMLNLEDM